MTRRNQRYLPELRERAVASGMPSSSSEVGVPPRDLGHDVSFWINHSNMEYGGMRPPLALPQTATARA